MKFLGGIAAALVLVSTSAMAADLRARTVKAPPAPIAVAYNWTGLYSATTLGGQWWDSDGTYVAPALGRHNTSDSNFVTGRFVGYQHQFGNWVLGVEGGFSQRWDSDYGRSFGLGPNCGIGAGITCETRLQNYWTAGAKVGYAWDRVMVYGTGGYANGSLYTRTILTAAPNSWTSYAKERQGGWYAGVGIDYYLMKFLWSDVIIGAEYQHIDLGNDLHRNLLATGAGFNRNVSLTNDIVRAKLTFKWTPAPAAVVAKY
ncbi:MAG: hypothetical protein A4S14_01505 [Proteobacteria bacterium SG_bin9]|nr:MAG: hypothetical protein A4S14_01505 [Proteobacteria bacterium SG_bin9]